MDSVTADIFNETTGLVRRFIEGDAFKHYVQRRILLVILALLVFLAFSIGITAGTMMFVGGTRSILVLFAMILSPFILFGSLFVEVFVFFGWLEGRAIGAVSGHKAELPQGKLSVASVRKGLGQMPPVPWVLAAIFIPVPFLCLLLLNLGWALLLLVLLIATPLVYILLDR